MRKKTAVLSIVILAVFSSLAFAGVPLYKHSRASKSDDEHRRKPSECQYERVYHDDDEGSDRDSSDRHRDDSDEECDD